LGLTRSKVAEIEDTIMTDELKDPAPESQARSDRRRRAREDRDRLKKLAARTTAAADKLLDIFEKLPDEQKLAHWSQLMNCMEKVQDLVEAKAWSNRLAIQIENRPDLLNAGPTSGPLSRRVSQYASRTIRAGRVDQRRVVARNKREAAEQAALEERQRLRGIPMPGDPPKPPARPLVGRVPPSELPGEDFDQQDGSSPDRVG
jgi:hypothetical protein